jgi:hypothetical protein
MNHSNIRKQAVAAVFAALGALGLAASAHAGTAVYVHAQQPVVVAAPVPVQRYADGGWQGGYEQRGWGRCGAPRWDPQERYMPGQVVWRHGALYMARGVSASVWNVNSPPEWTPQYWRPAHCE